jgi:hypothetical protein
VVWCGSCEACAKRTGSGARSGAIDLALAYAGITDPARIALAKRRALAEIRAQFGPGARVVGG